MTDKPQFIDRHRGGEKAILVQIAFPGTPVAERLIEFQDLARAANLTSLEVITGRRDKPSPRYYVGQGKAVEIAEAVNAYQAEVVLFNHDLTPAQGRNLERLFNVRVIDRAELILDIFAQRARTHEGSLQVELAQLQHISTRLIRGWTHLERQKGGIGLRGPGETQLETDRRLLGLRIKAIKKRLAKVVKQRALGRRARQRQAVPLVALVGYTNAGKSTLFNCLTKADVLAVDQLFATLDPTLRKITLPQINQVVIADTVGFIRELPHDLVAAFRATLEETRQADLLLHVVDCQQPQLMQTRAEVDRVLSEIEADAVPQLLVYNKIDLDETLTPRIDRDENGVPVRVWVSAVSEQGLDKLFQAIHELLAQRILQCQVTLTPKEGKLRAQLYSLGAVNQENIDAAGNHHLDLSIEHKDYCRLLQQREGK